MSQENLDVIALFKQAAYEVEGQNLENLTLQTELSDLSLGSVAVMEILGHVEQRLDIRFNDEELSRLTTLGDLAELIKKARRVA